MNKVQWQERQKTITCFISEAQSVGSVLTVSDIEQYCDLLHRYEATLHRLAEYACDGNLTNKQETALERNEQKVRDIAEQMRFRVRFNHDPRGGYIRFILPSGRSNGWDGETWGIYW